MPLYTLTTRAGVLTDAAKAKLAGELTTLHAEFSGVPRNWVHVVFQDYAPGNGFTAGEPSATAALTLLIRTGRSPEYKRELLQRLWTLFQRHRGARRPDRHRHSGSSAKPSHGDGADHAGRCWRLGDAPGRRSV
jgi:phenylpyruvate tautomerase PptA (4-oxalocrotonate tautomerase family)